MVPTSKIWGIGSPPNLQRLSAKGIEDKIVKNVVRLNFRQVVENKTLGYIFKN